MDGANSVIYRETGQFKSSYASDQAIFPIVQDRVLVLLGIAAAFVVPRSWPTSTGCRPSSSRS